VKELLSELKAACQSEPTRSERESIEQGPSTWFRGKPAHASDVLLRIDKLLKATPRAECGCEGEQTQDAGSSRRQKGKGPFGDIEIGDIEVCRLVCGDHWLGSIRIPVCVPVDCK
jgi:hypothetical protein